MPRVKICGITNSDDARAAAEAGADAIGLNLVGGPRRLTVPAARTILRDLPPTCFPVVLVKVEDGGVCVRDGCVGDGCVGDGCVGDGDGFSDEVQDLLSTGGVKHLQLYGQVTPAKVAQLAADGFETILVAHVKSGDFAREINETLDGFRQGQPATLLLDAHVAGQEGGTGTVVDWEAIASARNAGLMRGWPPLMLAGGLNPGNVAEAVATVRPWAVDVSSGVESSVGRKDRAKMMDFVAAASAATSAG